MGTSAWTIADEYYIESKRTVFFNATLRSEYKLPSIGEGTLTVFAPKPPDTDSQVISSSKLTVNGLGAPEGAERNQSRQMLGVRLESTQLRGKKQIDVRTEYRGKLYSRELKEGNRNSEVAELTNDSKRLYTSKTETMNWGNPIFMDWLSSSGLIRKGAETDIEFARRSYLYIVRNGKYGGDTNSYRSRRPSEVCKTISNDCGGLALLFVASMRANQIPARSLFGRWAMNQDGDYGQFHVIAEFYASGVGWVPVDISSAILHSPSAPEEHFGRDSGRFIVFHIDTDITPIENFTHGWAQYPIIHWNGSGDMWKNFSESSSWKVR